MASEPTIGSSCAQRFRPVPAAEGTGGRVIGSRGTWTGHVLTGRWNLTPSPACGDAGPLTDFQYPEHRRRPRRGQLAWRGHMRGGARYGR
jgi:hypothetical protein